MKMVMKILTNAVILAFGIFLFINAGWALEAVAVAIGIIIMLVGVFSLAPLVASFFDTRRPGGPELVIVTGGVAGLVLIILGVFIVKNPAIVISIIPWIVGIGILVHSVLKIPQSLELKKQGNGRWWVMLIFCVVMIALAVFIIQNPLTTAALPVQIMGVILIVDGVIGLTGSLFTHSPLKAAKTGGTVEVEKDGKVIEVVDKD